MPVGINYDRVFEDRSFLIELDTSAPRPGTAAALRQTLSFVFRNLWLLARSKWHRFGYACVNFGSPLSLKDHVRRHGVDLRTLGREERSAAIEELGRDLMAAVARVVPAVPVSLVATALLRDPARAWSELELKGAALDLVRELETRGAHVYVPRGDQDYAITVGLRMLTLRHLVTESDGLYSADPAELPLLSYYANSISHLLAEPPEAAAR